MPVATTPSTSPKMERLTPKQDEEDESGNNSDESTMAVDPVDKKNKNGGGLMRSMFGGGKKSKEKEDHKKHHHHRKESKSNSNNKKESKRSAHKNHHNHHHTSKSNAKMPTRAASTCEETEEDTAPAPTTKDVSPIATTRIPRRGGSSVGGILKEPSASLSQTARMASSSQQTKTVSFSNVYLREYARTVGDNPSVSSGPPIGISWDYLPTQTTSLESFEAKRCKNRKSRPEDLIVPRQVRVHLLKQVWGVPQNELAQAVRAVLKVKHARRTTIQNQGKSTEQVEEALESGFSMFKKALGSNKQQNKQKVLELQAQQKQAQTARQQERIQALQQLSSRQDQVQASSSGRGARPKRRLSVPQASPEDLFEDDNDDDLEMLQEDKEFGRVPPSCVVPRPDLLPSSTSPGHRTRQPNKSILKTTSQNQTNDTDYGYNDDSQQKSVSFAVNGETNKVWCLIKEFPAAPVKYHDDLWWPEHDLDDRYEQDMEIVQLLQHQYGNLLRNAYKSTKRRGNTNTNAPPVILDIDKLEHCSIARGLEAEVMPELRDICKTHQKAVLYKQEQVRGDSKFVAMMDDDDLERIRVGSCKFSRPSRLVAFKLAEFDAYDAQEDDDDDSSLEDQEGEDYDE